MNIEEFMEHCREIQETFDSLDENQEAGIIVRTSEETFPRFPIENFNPVPEEGFLEIKPSGNWLQIDISGITELQVESWDI